MPYSTPIGALDSIERQVRHVRVRRNLHALQRALYLAVAAITTAATVLLLLALRASTRLFAVAAWSVAAAVAVSVLLLVLEAARRWLRARDAAAWIDRRAELRGRLSTLLGSRGRRHAQRAAFMPLLLEQTVRQRSSWAPRRMVRHAVPLAALSMAMLSTAALIVALVLAPRLQPRVPEIVYSDQPVEGDVAERFEGVPDRVVIAPSERSARRKEDPFGTAVPAPGDDAAQKSALARLPSELQERIRDQLWGEAWSRMRDAMARAEQDERTAAQDGDEEGTDRLRGGDDTDTAGDEQWDDAALPPSMRPGRDGARGATRGAAALAGARSGRAQRGESSDEDRSGEGARNGTAAPGAGNGSDPNLYGEPSDLSARSGDTFELGIAARVRGRRGGAGPLPGEAPPAPPDAHPELASGQRAETAVHHMAVPAAYESLVREVFAHRDAGEGAEQ